MSESGERPSVFVAGLQGDSSEAHWLHKHKWMERAQCDGEPENGGRREEMLAWDKKEWRVGQAVLMKSWDCYPKQKQTTTKEMARICSHANARLAKMT